MRDARGLPAVVCSSLQSPGKCPVRPHWKQWEWCHFLGVLTVFLERKLCFVGDVDEDTWTTGWVEIIVSAARSRLARSWDRLRATASYCWISYSMAISQLWEWPRSITSLWCWVKASACPAPWWNQIWSSAPQAAACQSTVDISFSLCQSRLLMVRPPWALKTNSSSTHAALSCTAEVNKEYGT